MIETPEFLERLDKNFVKENLVFPYKFEADTNILYIAAPDEEKRPLAENLGIFFGKKTVVNIFEKKLIDKIIDEYYLENLENSEAPQNYKTAGDDEAAESLEITSEIKKNDLLYDTKSAEPTIKLVNGIIIQALIENATDIHIEPFENNSLVRYRINGVLYSKKNIAKSMHPGVTARIKILSNLDIAETRLPQDGSFQVAFAGKRIDFRVSTVPINFGERIVLRILDKTKYLIKLESIGMDAGLLDIFRKKINSPNGIILVTGPTGSGKTTTLYAALNELKTGDSNIITIEDPIEYQINGINQIQVKPEIGLDFAAGLRSILRQDPDIIMIGEIRDEETMNIAIQSSLTGHLVFSTLHTNDSIGAIVRLYNMGLKPYLISSSIICVIAQRLVRILCRHCKKRIILQNDDKKILNIIQNGTIEIFEENGCSKCNNTGFSGRKGIFEILNVDSKIREFINNKKHADEIKKYSLSQNMRFLSNSATDLLLAGETTVKEALNIITEENEV